MTQPRDQSNNHPIVTFYSFKGGTGRSMALANVAWILASNGCRGSSRVAQILCTISR
jgi:hypothetical protein